MASARSSGPDRTPVAAVAGLSGLVLDLRLIAAALTVIELATAPSRPVWLGGALAVVIVTSYLPLRSWDRLGPLLARHPTLIAADVLIGVAVLTVVGVGSPFLYYVIGTALLAGVLHGWRGVVVFSTLLVLGHWAALAMHAGAGLEVSFQALVGIPALYPLVGMSGAALRRMLEREAAVAAALRETAEAAAVAEERVRVAREMHDSLGKTLRGIADASTALPHWVHQRPDRAVSAAIQLAEALETATGELRALVGTLRADTGAGTAGQAVGRVAREWAAGHQTALVLDTDDAVTLAPEVRHELLRVLTEALENVARHAAAATVTVTFRAAGPQAVLVVADDGAGFAVPRDLTRLQRAGHYGLVGMDERARRAGGRLRVTARRGAGTAVEVRVPLDSPPPDGASAPGRWARGHGQVGAGSPGPRWLGPDSVRAARTALARAHQRR